jgi:hypothetical protein
VPLILIAIWHARHPERHFHRRALKWSAATITLAGAALDVGFGADFFTFTFGNAGATLGLRLPGWSWAAMAPIHSYLPIEEFAFYLLGGLFVAALYSWADCEWARAYDPESYGSALAGRPALLRISWRALVSWTVALAAALTWRAHTIHDGGFPGYFVFVMVLMILPTALFMRTIRRFVNWRAFTFTYFALLLVSLVWEVTLAIPYEWWNYQPTRMLGVSISAWRRLPVEAVLVWLVITWNGILTFEFFRIFWHFDTTVRRALLGSGASD